MMRSGFGKAVQGCLRLKEGGLLHIGLPCSSFIWLNRATSQRSADSPWGDENKLYISDSNAKLGYISKWFICIHVCLANIPRMGRKLYPRIAVRVLFLILLCTFRGVYTCAEQPMTSTFKILPTYLMVKQIISKFITPFHQSF